MKRALQHRQARPWRLQAVGQTTIGEFMLLLSAAIAAGAVAGFALAAIMVKAIFEHPFVRPGGPR